MLIDAPIPSSVIEVISAMFLLQFLGAFPWALSPLGALAYLGVSDVRRGLVHEDEAIGIYPSQTLPESTSSFFISLGGTQRLFLSVHPSFSRIARLMVAMDTLMP